MKGVGKKDLDEKRQEGSRDYLFLLGIEGEIRKYCKEL